MQKGIGVTQGAGFVKKDGGRQGLVPNSRGAEGGHPLAEEQVPSQEGHLGRVLGFACPKLSGHRSAGEVWCSARLSR